MGLFDFFKGGNLKVKIYKKAVTEFGKKMEAIPDWYNVVQKRGQSHKMFADSNFAKVDDFNFWANSHMEEYIARIEQGSLDKEGLEIRFKKFSYITDEITKVIMVAKDLKFNITNELYLDFCAAKASALGAKYTLDELINNNN